MIGTELETQIDKVADAVNAVNMMVSKLIGNILIKSLTN